MEQTDVKVGDWVSFREGQGQINLIYGDTVTIDTYQPNIAELEPIPLTKEILEKNGWKLIEGEYTKDDCKVCECLYLIQNHFSFSTFDSWTVIVGDSYIGTIYYLHELQHILWMLREDDNLTI